MIIEHSKRCRTPDIARSTIGRPAGCGAPSLSGLSCIQTSLTGKYCGRIGPTDVAAFDSVNFSVRMAKHSATARGKSASGTVLESVEARPRPQVVGATYRHFAARAPAAVGRAFGDRPQLQAAQAPSKLSEAMSTTDDDDLLREQCPFYPGVGAGV
ncbi:MAG: hypothetical protein QOG44_1824 [Acidimicrobiaceae bacterium]|nr:hypothetical protein [Acidimicrobiaceae bacterium]